ncbi:MAG: SDR family NAD(P)-dependent oxidoreductase [Actinomycetota bacterium]|nr:SDR family NAD(P)-dependent oxidoreductase [Actinomycetota bacterium]
MDTRGTSLTGRRALVTGASRGIGRAIAVLFAQEGADVAIVARNAEALDEVAAEVRATGAVCVVIPADVTADDAPQRIVDEAIAGLGGLDILVNNAGGNSFMAPLHTMRYSGWQKTMNLNLDSIVRLLQAALPAMIETRHASVINVSSVAGTNGSPFMSHYGAAKAALISLTRSVAVELATEGVRVNALIPGWIDTDLTGFLREDDGVEHAVIDRVPMKRWGKADEIAQGALFLASDASSFMTGQNLVLDGGLTANP